MRKRFIVSLGYSLCVVKKNLLSLQSNISPTISGKKNLPRIKELLPKNFFRKTPKITSEILPGMPSEKNLTLFPSKIALWISPRIPS